MTVLYLNPIFAAPSNHRYDTSDYFYVDPDLGTAEEFETLHRGGRGARHPRRPRRRLQPRLRRFTVVRPLPPLRGGGRLRVGRLALSRLVHLPPAGPRAARALRAPTEAGGDDTYYVSWWNFDSIPELNEIDEVDEMFVGEDGVIETWIERGTAGWRLDVADSMSHEFQAAIRDAAKDADPEAIVIAEQWHDSTPWLLGDQADSTMNYRFRRAVIALVNGATADPDGSLDALSPTGFANAMLGVREDYPEPAYQALMNLVDSHDTARILWTLTPGEDNDAAKTDPAALEAGKARLRLLSAIQLTFPGMASIYYGDEVGLTGFDDPDDRRPYPWGAEDLELREWYRTLAQLRASHEAIREGDLEFLLAEDARAHAGLPATVTQRRCGGGAEPVRPRARDRGPRGSPRPRWCRARRCPRAAWTRSSCPVAVLTVPLAPQSVAVLVSGDDADLTATAPHLPGWRPRPGRAGWSSRGTRSRMRSATACCARS